jgi:glycosyltransferase involved in cell wall biosynthesis
VLESVTDTIIGMNTTVGVIIPTFERPHETNRAVNSVINQSYKVQQIVVIDDGSSESNFFLLRTLLADKPVELIRIEPSRHPGVVRNVALQRMKSDWIAFLDSDDYWHPQKLEIQIKLATQNNTEAICSNADIINVSSGCHYPSNYQPGFISRRRLLKKNLIINSSVLVSRQILELSGGIESRYSMLGAEDYVTWLRISEHSNWFMSDKALVYYQEDSSDSVRRSSQNYEIDSQIQGLLGYFYSNRRNRLKSKLLKSIIYRLSK